MRALLGDVNSNGSVSGADVSVAKGRVGFVVDAATFRADINMSLSVSGADVNLVKNAVGTSVAGGAAQNTAPTISDIPSQNGESGAMTPAIGFAVNDAESVPGTLAVSATQQHAWSRDRIVFGGAARPARSPSPPPTATGNATITGPSPTAADASDTFVMTVVAPTKLYIGT